jgi:uncharacterized membrane protein YphA (DoxX/SURF4 family)
MERSKLISIAREALSRKTSLWPIALSRVLIGLLWLGTLRWKLPPDFAPATGRGLLDWLQLEVQHAAFGFYGALVESVVIPNFTLFAWLVFLSELLVGVMLVTGAWTRLAGALGLLMSLNLGIGLLEVPGEWPWSYIMMAMWHGLFLAAAAGRVLGVDAWLRRRLSPKSVWLVFT